MIIFWHWEAATGRISWKPGQDGCDEAAAPDARLPLAGDPLLSTGAAQQIRLSEALASLKACSGALAATIVAWPECPELDGARLSGFRSEAVASGIVEWEDSSPITFPTELTAALIEGIEALPEAFVLYDDQDRMIICNEQYRRLYPLVADMMKPGMRFSDVVHKSVARGVFQIDENSKTWAERRISFHQAGIGFFEQHLSDGRWIQVSERKTAFGGTTSIRADITVLKERERDLRAARAKAESEAMARTAFIAKVGHELRNPLNVILGIAQILAGEALPKRQRAMIDSLVGASRAMRDVLNDVLDIAKVQSGQVDIRLETVETRPFVQEMVNIARTMTAQKGLAMRSRIETTLPGRIVTDPRRLRQILFNLLGNAVKYTPSGSITLACSLRSPPGGQDVLEISVTDSGPGISPRLTGRVLQPYARQREHVSAGVEGLGLGLSISEELAFAIGARLGIGPGPRGGTRAWITIPVQPAGEPGHPRAMPAARQERQPGPPLNILVIDDEQTNLIVADALLQRLGHSVTTANDGQEGMRALRASSYDAVLLDISMPEISGIEIARRIAVEKLGGPGFAIIAMTGNVMPEDIKAYLAAGFTGFIEKPVEFDDLGELLASVRRDQAGHGVLGPGERVRFPRAESVRAFDRTPLDRMVADIGHDSVASIVATGIATFGQTIDKLASEDGEELRRLLHKVHAVAGLLGLDELASSAQRDERSASALTPEQRDDLKDMLARAIAQMELYALDLEVTAPPD